MNAYEYFIHEKWKCALNLQRAEERNAKAEEIEGIDRKIKFFSEAIEKFEMTSCTCKDCKWYKLHPDGDNGERMCKYWGEWIPTEETDFCSRGEKK